MEQTKYLVVGSSHAALEAVTAIRMHDPEGSLTLLTRDPHLPYSPTVLPYVVSGRSAPDGIFLRDEKFFADTKVAVEARHGAEGPACRAQCRRTRRRQRDRLREDPARHRRGARHSADSRPRPGVLPCAAHPGRCDETQRRDQNSKQAVVLGAGLVGMHAAENLVKAGASVTIVEMAKQLTDGYFDATRPA
jgi:phenylglyoxylate dehydrogenase epsilon subunit